MRLRNWTLAALLVLPQVYSPADDGVGCRSRDERPCHVEIDTPCRVDGDCCGDNVCALVDPENESGRSECATP